MKRSIGPMFIIGGILLILIVLFIGYRSCQKPPVTKIVPTPTPTPTLKEKLDRVEDTLEAIEKKIEEPKVTRVKPRAAAPARKAAAAAPLAMFYYEGDTVLGYDVPPKLYVLTLKANRSQLDLKECLPGSWNFPCTIYKTDTDGATVKLLVAHCVDFRAAAKFDEVSCQNQKNYNNSFAVK